MCRLFFLKYSGEEHIISYPKSFIMGYVMKLNGGRYVDVWVHHPGASWAIHSHRERGGGRVGGWVGPRLGDSSTHGNLVGVHVVISWWVWPS